MASMVLLVLSLLIVGGSTWVNQYDKPFTFYCPRGQSIKKVVSRHDNYYEDRLWDFTCQKTPGIRSCRWTIYENEWDHPFMFQCQGQGVIGGVSSYHKNYYEDRRFQFLCCHLNRIKLNTCRFTDYVNTWDAYFNYSVPSGHVLRGASSYHNNKKEDRRWKFETCSLRRPQEDE